MAATVPQTRPTEKFSKSLGGSLKSLVGTKGRTYFLLEHKTNTQKFKVGQTREFIGDYIELGRGNSFAVGFGEDCQTVSRPHAAIVRKPNGWAISPLSKVNPTLVNGIPIKDEVILHNGDEIKLSFEGPKLAFLIPADPSVKSMGMSIRLKAMANEAIKPYKTAVISLGVLLVAAMVGLTYLFRENRNLLEKVDQAVNITKAQADSLLALNRENKSLLDLQKSLTQKVKLLQSSNTGVSTSTSNPPTLKLLYPNIYYIKTHKIIAEVGGETKEIELEGSGTGFLLNDGHFVTARHVVEPWFYYSNAGSENEDLIKINLLASNGGTVTHIMKAYSPSGEVITINSNDFVVDREGDLTKKIESDNQDYVITIASIEDGSDWATYQIAPTRGLPFNKALSKTLPASTKMYVLGYPFGIGVNNRNDIKPVYSECNVSRDGLDKGGIIDVSSRSFDPGNSGGPVFIKKNNQYVVVGIVSAIKGQQGFAVPISAIR